MYAESITHVWRNLGISDARQDFFGILLLDCLKNNYECHFSRSLVCIKDWVPPKLYDWSGSNETNLFSNLEELTQTHTLIVSRKKPNSLLLFLITPTNQIEPRSKLNGKNPFQTGLSSTRRNLFLGNLRRQVDVGYCTVVIRELGSISSTMAKLWTLKMAFSLARQLNLENINLELDAEVLVYMLFSLSSVNLMSETLLTDFRNLMRSLLTAQWLIFIGNPSW